MAIRLGTSIADKLVGTPLADYIRGYAGDDTLVGDDAGGAGNDIIVGDEGNDIIYGGVEEGADTGNDVMMGGDGDDSIFSYGGRDYIDGGDELLGGDGDFALIDRSDASSALTVYGTGFGGLIPAARFSPSSAAVMSDGTIFTDIERLELIATDYSDRLYLANNFGLDETEIHAGAGGDVVQTGSSVDKVWGEDGNDYIGLGAGDDTAYGGVMNDTVDGGAGDDVVRGGDGNDSLLGGDDNDELFGGDGNDIVSGGDGDDELHGGADQDTYIGGEGADSFYLAYGTIDFDLIADYEPGEDTIIVSFVGIEEEDVLIDVLNPATGLVSVAVDGMESEYFFADGITSSAEIETQFLV
ncbi:hypothetical protein DLJ53_19655 [Acuticoccus sediminis]|uniref:Hemolysin-type calcium-binding repeat-containing protein n=1 Tax=Acuticoccus sediminis TaxID=2184697 RepID=A0A8B2NKE0_9HYPH|nr:calcium-binding protein [Acuticoccus sediminis]RAH99955.1 hypothetical protein DLJ53_19655 [Acuticoccus sediminis]